MSNEDGTSSSSTAGHRRATFSHGAQPFTGLFGRSSIHKDAPPPAFPSPIATAAANAQHRRRMSISTLGLSGNSPTQTSPSTLAAAASAASRRDSTSSAGTGSTIPNVDESVIEEGESPLSFTAPNTPLGRRMSFGARALREVRTAGAGAGVGAGAGSNGAGIHAAAEGFNWSDSFRARAERTASLSTSPSAASASAIHQRALGRGAVNLPSNASAPGSALASATRREMPKPPVTVPDAFQERILKGDFYID
ncbi:MAG: hypothetical protein M1826_003703 [Phylliscum demangeonii]|nr:MAG: hypothetical protein M1826_003703 [Phylliscum demangeonii]